jgi:hypothetical protein
MLTTVRSTVSQSQYRCICSFENVELANNQWKVNPPCLLDCGHFVLIGRKKSVRKEESQGGGGEDKNVRIMQASKNRYTVVSVDDLISSY